MKTRRQFIRFLFSMFSAGLVFWGKFRTGCGVAYAKAKKILLPRGTNMSALISKNPAELDGSLLSTTPMLEFDVMGQDIYDVDLKQWRLKISGEVRRSSRLTYDQMRALPAMEKNVLLICRGFFAYNALWKGLSMPHLLKRAGVKPHATHVKFSGPDGIRKKTREFTLDEVMENKVFIAYQVNGTPLPERHGFPARVVAKDHYGKRWVKYVNQIEVISG